MSPHRRSIISDSARRKLLASLLWAKKRVRGFATRIHLALEPKPPPLPLAITMSDEEFLQLFELPAVTDHLISGDVAGAMTALLGHFETRVSPEWPPFPKHMTQDLRREADVVDQADRILRGFVDLDGFGEVHFDSEIDWLVPINNDPRGEATRKLNRHAWWAPVVEAYRVTRSDRYAEFLVNCISSWVTCTQRPAAKDESSRVWGLMEAGIRCLIWPTVYGVLQESPRFTPRVRSAMLRFLYDHAVFLTRHTNKTNHLLREANGLAHLSACFPEFAEAEDWWDIATSRLVDALDTQVNIDGSHFELCTTYQVLALEEFEYALQLLNQRNDPRATDMAGRLKTMYRALAFVTLPDGSLPLIGDGFLPKDFDWSARLEKAARKFRDPEMIYIATRGEDGAAPSNPSVAVPDAGWHVMRDGWEHTSRYLLFECGPSGGHHGHEDKLSIVVSAYGTSFLVDPGTYTYNRKDPERNFFMSSRAHNLAAVAGMSQVRRWNPEYRTAKVQPGPHALWQVSEVFDFVSSRYDQGYGNFHLVRPAGATIIGDVSHKRHVVFIKPDYWIVIDEIRSKTPRALEAFYHAAPGLEMTRLDAGVVVLSAAESSPRLLIIPEPSEFEGPTIARGQTHPLQGWVSSGTRYQKVPADTATYSWSAREALHHATLLWPFPGTVAQPVPHVRRADSDSGRRWEITRPDSHLDVVTLEYGADDTPAELQVERRSESGDVLVSGFWLRDHT